MEKIPIRHAIRCMGCEIRRPGAVTFHLGSSVGGASYDKLSVIPNVGDTYPGSAVLLVNDSMMLVLIEDDLPEPIQALVLEVTTKHCPPGSTSIKRSVARNIYAELFNKIANMVDDGRMKREDSKWIMDETKIPKEVLS